jgi:type IV pilus assembly protein PilM
LRLPAAPRKMFGLIQNLFAPGAHPIGVDFGTHALRLAQVQTEDGDYKLFAAASAEIPDNVRDDAEARFEFFSHAIPHLLHTGKFRAHRAVLGIPPSVVHTQHLTLDPMDQKLLKDAVIECAKQKIPFDAEHALFRHTVAGQTRESEDPRLHVIVMAADTRWVNRYITAAGKAGLYIVGLNMQPPALLDCFSNVYRRTAEQQSVRMYVDIGSSGSRAFIAQNTHLLFARNLTIGGDDMTRAVADALSISLHDARTLRIKLAAGSASDGSQVNNACRGAADELIKQLDACRREHELAFPHLAVHRVIFVGGEARQESLCKYIAQTLKLPGQTGDSLCRMARRSRIDIESAIDRRYPQPAWAAAIGLSMGREEAED